MLERLKMLMQEELLHKKYTAGYSGGQQAIVARQPIFDESGKLSASASLENADTSGEAVLSPGGTVLAVDLGGSLVRDWTFFAVPSMKRLDKEGVGYYAACAIGQVNPDKGIRPIIGYMLALLIGTILVAAIPWISIGFL